MKIMTRAALIALALSTTGLAQATVYTSEAAFDAANPGLATVDFSGLTTSITDLASPFVKDGLTFSAPALTAVSTNFWGSVDSLLDDTFNGSITMTFAPVTAVGFYVAGDYYDGTPISISFYDGANLLFSATPDVGGVYGAFTFYGIDDIGSFDRVVLDSASTGGFASIGPVTIGEMTAVPEPTTWAMMIGGFALAGAAMRGARRRVAFA